jgi:hypothetical protein
MELIESKTLVTAATSIAFTSIPQTFTDLVVLLSCRSNLSADTDYIGIRFNNSTTGFTTRILFGTGSTASTETNTSLGQPRLVGHVPATNSTANTFGNTSIYIPNYTSSVNKQFSADSVTENNGTVVRNGFGAIVWANTAAINSITFEALGNSTTNNYSVGSTISLYGILKGSL